MWGAVGIAVNSTDRVELGGIVERLLLAERCRWHCAVVGAGAAVSTRSRRSWTTTVNENMELVFQCREYTLKTPQNK